MSLLKVTQPTVTSPGQNICRHSHPYNALFFILILVHIINIFKCENILTMYSSQGISFLSKEIIYLNGKLIDGRKEIIGTRF